MTVLWMALWLGVFALVLFDSGKTGPAILSVLTGATMVSRWVSRRRRRRRVYTETAGRMSLRAGKGVLIVANPVLEGEFDGFHLSVEEEAQSWTNSLKVVVDGGERRKGAVPRAFSLRRRVQTDDYRPGEVNTGDDGFDEAAHVGGSPDVALALLGGGLRTAVSAALDSPAGLEVEGGRVTTRQRNSPRPGPRGELTVKSLEAFIRSAVTSARDFVLDPADIPRRLAVNAGHDEVPGVRRRNLEMLATKYATRPEAAPVLRKALGDDDGEVRFLAARALGEEGYETLLGLLVDAGTAEDLAARVLDHMAGNFPPERVLPFALKRASGADGPLRLSLVKAIAARGDSSHEGTLLESLTGGSAEVRFAAVEALARVGTAAAVAPLKGIVSDRPLDLGLRRAVDGAVAAIQGRLEGAGAGQVCLAEERGDAGSVSLAGEAGEGRLSLTRRYGLEEGGGS